MRIENLTIENETISSYSFQSNKKKNLIFLHGYGSKIEFYRVYLKEMSKHYNIYAPLIYGINDFENNPVFFDRYCEFTASYIDALNLDNFVLAGHSYGALVAFKMAQLYETATQVLAINSLWPEEITISRLVTSMARFAQDLTYTDGEIASLAQRPQVIMGYSRNAFKDVLSYVRGALNANEIPLTSLRCDKPVSVLHSTNDALFSLDYRYQAKLKTHFKDIEFSFAPDYSHNWILYHSEDCADYSLKLLSIR